MTMMTDHNWRSYRIRRIKTVRIVTRITRYVKTIHISAEQFLQITKQSDLHVC